MADKEALKGQLFDMFRNMEEEGLVDVHFRLVYSLKEVNGPNFYVELLETFLSDSQTTIREMTQILEQPTMNYYELNELCMKIKGGSACLGACRMAHACGALRQAINEQSKQRCIASVEAIKTEFLRVREKLENITQLERIIISLD